MPEYELTPLTNPPGPSNTKHVKDLLKPRRLKVSAYQTPTFFLQTLTAPRINEHCQPVHMNLPYNKCIGSVLTSSLCKFHEEDTCTCLQTFVLPKTEFTLQANPPRPSNINRVVILLRPRRLKQQAHWMSLFFSKLFAVPQTEFTLSISPKNLPYTKTP